MTGPGKQLKIVSKAQRVSRAHKLLDAPELQELLLDGFNLSGVIVVDAARIVVYASPKSLQALEITGREIIGKNFTDAVPLLDNQGELIPESKRPSVKALTGTSVQATLFFCQYRLPATGELIPIAVRAVAIRRKDKVLGAIVELRRTTRQLDVDGMKSLFTGFAAHQLKTPSSIVKGFLELLIRQGKSAYKSEQWSFLESAFEANERLIRLSQTLLKITRLEGGMIELRASKTNIVRVLEDKLQSYRGNSKGKGITFVLDIVNNELLTRVSTDSSFVSEIVDVLVDNALKVVSAGSKITLGASVTNNQLEISVQDQGPGLPQEILSKLRGPLAQHQPGSSTGGNGLGLYMARKYAAMLQGDITAENIPGGGAKLTLMVPMQDEL